MVREFIGSVVEDPSILDLIDNPGQMMPGFDRDNPFALCEQIDGMPLVKEKFGPVCAFATEDMPDLSELADTIDNLPVAMADQICESVPSLDCSGDEFENRRSCRRECRARKRSCNDSCDPLAFRCKRQCELLKNDCIACCNNSANPGGCGF